MKAIVDIHPFLKASSIVNVRKLGADELSKIDSSNFAHRLDITFKDQNVSRRDMFQLAQSMNMQTVYRGKTIEFEGIRARIRQVFDNADNESTSAIVSMQRTKFSFFTKSC